jgi:hypothetical protein
MYIFMICVYAHFYVQDDVNFEFLEEHMHISMYNILKVFYKL